ncbi:MAG: 3'-5' exonuclease domain-containing protein 2 [Bacteroidales bacterium]|jgi:ribonuclease D|nr:3'-5' exonuclease domain-containing protein 2 [Bacteroidales bacterium]MCU0410275.1 3'-5' exonuclease domain-containing protein 2 [Bacteroidales bacterium]
MTRQYNESVSDEDLKKLPVSQFEGRVTLVDNMTRFHKVMPQLSKPGILGFDTETKPSFKKGQRHKVSLLQFADDHNAWLFRLNMIGLPEELAAMLSDPKIIKVGVAIHDDIKALRHLRHFEPGGFIDLQTVVTEHGIKQLGLKKLSALILGFSISKSQQVSNWEAPALTESQMAYAATDAWVCRRIYFTIKGKETYL